MKYNTVSGIVFAVVSILHLMRCVFGLDMYVGDWFVPVWASLAGFIGAGALSAWAFLSTPK